MILLPANNLISREINYLAKDKNTCSFQQYEPQQRLFSILKALVILFSL
jgi:hypothetical protein